MQRVCQEDRQGVGVDVWAVSSVGLVLCVLPLSSPAAQDRHSKLGLPFPGCPHPLSCKASFPSPRPC